MPILEVKNICKSFGSTEVLKGISFSLEQGQVVSIIGSSGSGKTTLLRCINMLEKATKGQVLVNDEVIFDAADPATQKDREMRKKRLHFGFVFQSFNLFPQYTALKNVMLAPELAAKERPDYKQNRKEIHAQLEREARGYLEQVGLGDKVDNYPYQLSGGQQQRVALARALAHLRAGSRAHRRGAAGHPRSGRSEDHHDHRDPRDGLCPGCGRSGHLYGRRCRGGAGRLQGDHQSSQGRAYQAVPVPIHGAIKRLIRAGPYRCQPFLHGNAGVVLPNSFCAILKTQLSLCVTLRISTSRMPRGVDGCFKLLRFAQEDRLKVCRGCAEGSPLKGKALVWCGLLVGLKQGEAFS